MVFFAILGDPSISDWYPFTKNFSSVESILYVSNSTIFSPLDVFLGALVRRLGHEHVRRPHLGVPAAARCSGR